jgi:hypothetical protein
MSESGKDAGFRQGGYVTGSGPVLPIGGHILEMEARQMERLREVQGPPIVGRLSKTINIKVETCRGEGPKDFDRLKSDLRDLMKSVNAEHIEAEVVEPLALPAPEPNGLP